MTNLYELIHRRVQAAPQRIAIETADGHRLTYAELDERCARVAARLARLGVRPGDRVAVQVEKSVANLLLYLACLRRGAVYLPLNTAYTLSELDYFFGDAEPALVVCDPARRAEIAALGSAAAQIATLDAYGQGDLVDTLDEEPAQAMIAPVSDDDLAALLYTSGTTGRAKGAMLTHRNLASNALTLVDAWGFSETDALLHALPLYHVHGLFVACNTALLAGAPPAVPAALRCRRGARSAAARDGHDGRADLLHPAAGAGRAVGRALRRRPPVRLGLGASARADLLRLRGAHRPPPSSSATA